MNSENFSSTKLLLHALAVFPFCHTSVDINQNKSTVDVGTEGIEFLARVNAFSTFDFSYIVSVLSLRGRIDKLIMLDAHRIGIRVSQISRYDSH